MQSVRLKVLPVVRNTSLILTETFLRHPYSDEAEKMDQTTRQTRDLKNVLLEVSGSQPKRRHEARNSNLKDTLDSH